MKIIMNKKTHFICLFLLFSVFFSCTQQKQERKKLRFVFATDIHLNKANSRDRLNGFIQALDSIKASKIDFVIFGGDLVDISGITNSLNRQQADSMYTVFKQTVDKTGLTCYPTIGNHDRYFDENEGYIEGDELFKAYFKESYYTFEKEGVRFFILNSVQYDEKRDGFLIGEKQMEWLRKELSAISSSVPIVVSTHVPVYSIYYPVVDGVYVFRDIIANYKELLKTFEEHNLKLVLQGHQHVYEEIFSQDVQYITAGAVCAKWWDGKFHGTKEGFQIVEVDENNNFSWKYAGFGWIPK
jgi:3',5'-cyclic AMP phosphodiesterase CpdA